VAVVEREVVEIALGDTLPGSTVTIVVEGDNRVGGTARLSVVDDGAGIPSDAQAHVFDRFFRIEGTVAAGSGLGLAIAREVAGLMDGRVELVSRPGETRFTLVLPADAFGHPPTAGTLRSEEEEAPRRGSGRIAQV
jgi:signal transduction histidine kinase